MAAFAPTGAVVLDGGATLEVDPERLVAMPIARALPKRTCSAALRLLNWREGRIRTSEG